MKSVGECVYVTFFFKSPCSSDSLEYLEAEQNLQFQDVQKKKKTVFERRNVFIKCDIQAWNSG